jgi:NADPH-dependent curcumin reductase CurA
MKGREIRLAARPTGLPDAGNFSLVEVDVRDPGPGEVRVRNIVMSVDPYMRGRMNDVRSYAKPFQVGEVLYGDAVGVVEASKDASLPEGTTVIAPLGWRDYAVAPAGAFRVVDTNIAPAAAYLGTLGMPGFTAWVGLFAIADMKAGDTVLMSSAAGAVGSLGVQLAKRRGAHVIGTTRSAESAQVLREKLKLDDVIVLEPGNIAKQFAAVVPGGIDVYFDNVGGEQLEAALFSTKDFARVVACGMISNYNEPLPGPRNLMLTVARRLTIRGFIVSDYAARQPEFIKDVAPAVASGEIVTLDTTVDGLENAPAAFVSLFTGSHVGKLVVRIAPS